MELISFNVYLHSMEGCQFPGTISIVCSLVLEFSVPEVTEFIFGCYSLISSRDPGMFDVMMAVLHTQQFCSSLRFRASLPFLRPLFRSAGHALALRFAAGPL